MGKEGSILVLTAESRGCLHIFYAVDIIISGLSHQFMSVKPIKADHGGNKVEVLFTASVGWIGLLAKGCSSHYHLTHQVCPMSS